MGPDQEATRLGLWLAGIFGMALVSILGIIARAVLAERQRPARTTPWTEERGAIMVRLDTLEREILALREWKHDKYAHDYQELFSRLDKLEYDK